MYKSFENYYVEKISTIIEAEIAERPNLIFVLLGHTALWHTQLPRATIADSSRLRNENKHHSFSKDWPIFRLLPGDTLRLQMHITFPKYSTPIKALLPYTDKPVEFYKWWCDNPDKVTLNFKEKLMLFEKVNSKNPKTLKSEHRKMICVK